MPLGERFLEIASRRVELPGPDDALGWRILADYGAVYVSTATPPARVVFRSPREVERFQASLDSASAPLEGVEVTLQRPALEALLRAADEARALGLRFAPRAADASARSWGDSESLWRGRVERAAAHWLALGRLAREQVDRLLSLPTFEQTAEVLDLERGETWFSTYFDKSILYSVAAPGTSQHLSMLAFDVADYADAELRRLLPRHGWFQTVVSDLPHYTFLGRDESELPGLGLRRVTKEDEGQEYVYWVPGTSGE
jgi:hypothetical protein